MSIVSLNTGLRSLLAAQYALDTVGHNIANANTPGYSPASGWRSRTSCRCAWAAC